MKTINLTEDHYRKLALEVGKELPMYYHKDITEVEFPDFSILLNLDLVITREKECFQESFYYPIRDVQAAWWEAKTVDEDGNECLNDFSFTTLRDYLIDWE